MTYASIARQATVLVALLSPTLNNVCAQEKGDARADYIRSHYAKFEYRIAMRDGTKLFTTVYVPNDTIPEAEYPIILVRTPYGVGPYGVDRYKTRLGPSQEFEKSGYIFAFQDVRGCYMSEGDFVNMRPHIETKTAAQFDESSDTFDTIEWLTKNVSGNNGRVGQWGISYPGFYTSAGAIDSHPSLKCISSQNQSAIGACGEMHRNGAFNVQLAFTFFSSFGKVRSGPTVERNERLDIGTDDAYQFFLDLGSLKNVNDRYFKREIPFWNEISEHPNYDSFWQSRNLVPHLKNLRCASLVVGGWFDTEDLYGPLRTYSSIETNNRQIENSIVMGPWHHGGWNGADGDRLGDASFDWATAKWYRDEVEFPFFERHLKHADGGSLAEATMFETGANRWRRFDTWPPAATQERSLYLRADEVLAWEPPEANSGGEADSYPSDPRKPVPYTTEIKSGWAKNYMTEDQRFAARRPDVLVYRTPVLESDVTVAGPMLADLWFSTTGTDADIVVKIIDEFPGRRADGARNPKPGFQSGRQQLVRAQVIRARFRGGFEVPQPLVAGQVENIQFELHDVLHNFKRGHRIMVQIQSSWFPFVDRNPQKYVPNIFEAEDDDFIFATHTVYRDRDMPSCVRFRILTK